MITLKYFFLINLISLSLFAQGIEFTESNWQSVKDKAASENKLIMVDVFADWCVPCKKMDKEVFKNDEVGKFYNANFINYKIDAEKGEGVDVSKEYDVMFFPSILYVDGSGKLIDKKVGYIAAKEFIEVGESVLNPELRLSSLQEKYQKGERDLTFLRNYINSLGMSYQDNEAVVNEYFSLQSENELISKDNLDIILKYVNKPESKVFQHFLKFHSKYTELSNSKTINDKIFNTYGYYAYMNSQSWTENDLKSMYETIKSYEVVLPKWFEMRTLSGFYQAKGDWKKYFTVVSEYVNNHFDYTDKVSASNLLNDYAWTVYENMSDKKSLKKASKWAKKSIELHENYYNLDTYACLLYKLGKFEQAKLYCKKAIKLGKEAGEDTKPSEEILKKIEEEE